MPAFRQYEGREEHPEELTDRCCLSALAGLSKYLPSLGACGIIVLLSCYVNLWLTYFQCCYQPNRLSFIIILLPYRKFVRRL